MGHGGSIARARFLWNGSEGNRTVHQEHVWHTDRSNEPHATTYGFHLYLDPVRADTGCLRGVIPRLTQASTHDVLCPINAQKPDSTLGTFGLSGPDMPCHIVESDPGDIIFFHQKIYHDVYGPWPGRRFLKLKFVRWPETRSNR